MIWYRQAARPEWTVTQLAAVEEKLEKASDVWRVAVLNCWMCMEFWTWEHPADSFPEKFEVHYIDICMFFLCESCLIRKDHIHDRIHGSPVRWEFMMSWSWSNHCEVQIGIPQDSLTFFNRGNKVGGGWLLGWLDIFCYLATFFYIFGCLHVWIFSESLDVQNLEKVGCWDVPLVPLACLV